MFITLLMLAIIAVMTAGGVAIAHAGDNEVHVNSSAAGVLACLLAISIATLAVTMGGLFITGV